MVLRALLQPHNPCELVQIGAVVLCDNIVVLVLENYVSSKPNTLAALAGLTPLSGKGSVNSYRRSYFPKWFVSIDCTFLDKAQQTQKLPHTRLSLGAAVLRSHRSVPRLPQELLAAALEWRHLVDLPRCKRLSSSLWYSGARNHSIVQPGRGF